MDEYVSKSAVQQMLHEAYADDVLSTKAGCRALYKRLNGMPASDVQPISQWISVKDRLPETGESVLVYVAINKNLKGFGECKPEIRIGWLDDGGKWALQFSNMNYSEVLYWLPLPELPKDGDTNG